MKILWTALISGTFLVCAHDMYLLPSTFFPSSRTLTVGFHVGDSFPESEVAVKAERLLEPRLLWKGGSAPLTNLRVRDKTTVGDATIPATGELIAAVSTMKSLIELEPAKFLDYLKEEGLTDVIAWRASRGENAKPGRERYSKYAKSILLAGTPDGFGREKTGFIIEIVPEADPYKLKAGDSLPIQVLFRGKPAAGIQIETAWVGPTSAGKSGPSKTIVPGRTNAEGRFKVPMTAAGRWRIHTLRMERCAEPAVADWESFWASLTLEVR